MKQPVENTHLYKLKMVPSDVHWSSLRCKCKCSIDFSYEKTVHRWIRTFFFHSLV